MEDEYEYEERLRQTPLADLIGQLHLAI